MARDTAGRTPSAFDFGGRMQSSGAGVSACVKWRMSRNWLCARRAAARPSLALGQWRRRARARPKPAHRRLQP
eukprot:3740923-Prorocentrum_lima.AAC.1